MQIHLLMHGQHMEVNHLTSGIATRAHTLPTSIQFSLKKYSIEREHVLPGSQHLSNERILRNSSETLPCCNPRIAFRDVTNRLNNRTTVVALLPPEIVLTNKGPYLLRIRGNEADEAYLLSVMASTFFDWFSRRYVERNLNFFILNPLPIPRPGNGSKLRQRAIELAGRLAAQDSRLNSWAASVGVECGELTDIEMRNMIMELDAVVARLFGLSEQHIRTIYRTFHHNGTVDEEPWASRFNAVMEHYNQLEGEDE